MNSPIHTDTNAQTPAQRQTMSRSSFYLVLFLLSLLFINFSDDETQDGKKPTVEDILLELRHERESLGNVTYAVNVTHPLSDSMQKTLASVAAIGHGTAPLFYQNITGVFRGEWKSQNETLPPSDTTYNQTLEEINRGEFKFTGLGSYTLNLKSIKTEDEHVHYIEGYMHLNDAEKSNFGAMLLTEGVHFLRNGSLYLMAVPEEQSFLLQDLLHMLPSNTTMDMARSVLTEHIDAQIERLESYAASALQPSSGDKKAPFACQFHMYGQLHPVPDPITASELEEYEKELEDPQGIDTIPPPSLHLTHVLYSPNCGLSLAMDRGRGIRIEKYFGKAIAYACMATAMTIGQIFLLIHQVEYTPTPSSVTNVSYLTIIMQAIMDGYLCLLHLTAGIVIDTVFLPFAATSFFGFILVSVFGMRYLLVIWRIQRPETTRPTRPTDADVGTDADAASSLPLQHENPPSTEPESALSSTTRDVGAFYCKLYMCLLFGLFVFYQIATSPAFIQNIAIAVLGFTFYSFWVPQIIRNISRGCRRPLSPRYVLGMSVTRLAIPLYFYGCPENILAHKPTPWIWCLVAYVFLQVFVLFLQDALGPRFFVPERFLPQTYNYHPVLTAEDEETVQGENTVTEGVHSSPSKDCAICMLPVEMTPHGSTMNVLGRVHYMVTPCHHMFHTDCLEKWMRIKLECPVCRAYLPAC